MSDPASPALEFWYEFASTYSYPAAARVEALAARSGVAVAWRPFLLGPIFASQGWSDSPFNLYPAKGRYMWRDLERICSARGLPFRRPSAFPRNGLLAARVALVADAEGWCPDFSRAVYHANFADDREIAEAETLGDLIAELGREPAPVLARAGEADTKRRLRDQTERAVALGLFGAPTAVAGGELFWGDDRLEQALEWAQRGES